MNLQSIKVTEMSQNEKREINGGARFIIPNPVPLGPVIAYYLIKKIFS